MRLSPITTAHKWLNIPDQDLATYNYLDTVATAKAIQPMIQEATDLGMWDFWEREVWPMMPAVMAMQRRGLLVDQGAKTQYRKAIRRELSETDKVVLDADESGGLHRSTPKAPNGLGSPQRVASFLYDHLGLRCHKRTPTGGRATDQEALIKVWEQLRKKDSPHLPVLESLFHRSRLVTIDSRYLDFYIHPDGRVRPTVKVNGAISGRFAYADPALQQYPPEARHIFRPAPGHVFVGADYEQLEARIAAYLAGIRRDLDVFDSGEDLHAITAREVFGFTGATWESLPAAQRKAARNYAKSFRYRLAYGGDPTQVGALGSKVFCPCWRCEALAPPSLNLPAVKITAAGQAFLHNRPEIERWRERLIEGVLATRTLTNPLGRKVMPLGPIRDLRRFLFNWPIQSTAADIINRAMRRGWERYRLPYFLQMHDYLGVECPECEAEERMAQLVEVMEEVVPEMPGLHLPVEPKIESPWGVEQ